MIKNSRRNLLKLLSAAGGAVTVSEWTKPIITSVILPVHAATTTGDLIRQWGDRADGSSYFVDAHYSEATGAPDTFECGDSYTAHSFAEEGGTGHYLNVWFKTPVIPTEVSIRISYNPGGITSVELLSGNTSVLTVPNSAHSADPDSCTKGGQSPVLFILDLSSLTETCIDGIRMNVDQTQSDSYHQVDAVELVGYAC